MAERPVFIPVNEESRLVEAISVSFTWNKGMAPSQKMKNVDALHKAASELGHAPLLEVSTKSKVELGWNLSAFNLTILVDGRKIPLECAYQGSKIFEYGGPYKDLYEGESRDAKRDERLKSSGELTGFRFGEFKFEESAKNVFYDWLYICALSEHEDSQDYHDGLRRFVGFTDIEFNPKKSLNNQARACAIFIALDRREILDDSLKSPEKLRQVLSKYSPVHSPLIAERTKPML